MSLEQSKSVMRRFYELYDSGQLDAIEREVFDPNAIVHLSGVPTPLSVPDYKQFGLAFHTAFPNHHSDIQEVVAEGDTVVARTTFRGTQTGELQGIPPSGKAVTFTGVEIFRLAGGKVVEAWSVFDQFDLLQQLGVVPTPPAPPAAR